MEKIKLQEVERVLESQNHGWSIVEDKWLMKRYRFTNYLNGLAFVHKIATLSEEVNHHPFISIDYKLISIKLTSWKANGITELDLKLINQYDHLYDSAKK